MDFEKHIYAVKSALFGIAVGDALGVPVEFKSRYQLEGNPITDMTGYGTYNQPPGTWSDDSSLAFCLAEALTQPFDSDTIGAYFLQWYKKDFWTPHGKVFDIGMATEEALCRIMTGMPAVQAGGTKDSSNGNGSLMRILPLVFYIKDKTIAERFEITRIVSSITHAHIRSVIACFYYLEFARLLLHNKEVHAIYRALQSEVPSFLSSLGVHPDELSLFSRIFNQDISILPESEIKSSGYVLHTLEASVWCLMNADSYAKAVLTAVNLGDDTDTTAAVTGGLAGLQYGLEQIPAEWLGVLARKEDIEDLTERFSQALAV